MRDWWRLLCRAYYIVRLRLTRRRRLRRIAELERALGLALEEETAEIGPGSWTSYMTQLQGSIVEVVPTNYQQLVPAPPYPDWMDELDRQHKTAREIRALERIRANNQRPKVAA